MPPMTQFCNTRTTLAACGAPRPISISIRSFSLGSLSFAWRGCFSAHCSLRECSLIQQSTRIFPYSFAEIILPAPCSISTWDHSPSPPGSFWLPLGFGSTPSALLPPSASAPCCLFSGSHFEHVLVSPSPCSDFDLLAVVQSTDSIF